VVLVDETGMPRWHRMRVGGNKDEAVLSAQPGRPLSLSSWSRVLVELVADPPCARYTFRAEVRHDKASIPSDAKANVGLCLAHAERGTGPDGECYSCLLVFADHAHLARSYGKPPAPPGCRSELVLLRYAGQTLTPQGDSALQAGKPFPPSDGHKWYRLEVNVTPARISARWDGQDVGDVDPRQLGELARLRLALNLPLDRQAAGFPNGTLKLDANAPLPIFRPLLGLYVRNGAASFRNVVVEPTPDNP
jgi:hypothetical protein